MILSGTESWNLPRNKGQKNFLESYTLRCCDPTRPLALWYRQEVSLGAELEDQAALWFHLYDGSGPQRSLCINQTYSLEHARIESDIFYFSVAGGEFYHNGSHGRLEIDGKSLEWQLQWEPSEKVFRYLPLRSLYRVNAPLFKLVAPNPEIHVSGWLRWGEVRYEINGIPGYQSHHWGRRYPESWCWGQVAQFEGYAATSFEGLSYRFQRKKGRYPRTSQFRIIISGKEYRLNRIWRLRRNLSQGHVDRWHVESDTGRRRFIGDVFVNPQQISGQELRDTDGSSRFAYRTDTAQLKLQLYRKKGRDWLLARELKSLPTMAYEFVSPTAIDGIPLF